MATVPFLVSAGALVLVTYLIRLAGMWWGVRNSRSRGGSGDAGDAAVFPAGARRWLDRAVIVLIVAVAAGQAVFDGQDPAGAARLVGVGSGVVALLFRVPVLPAVALAMAVTALLRLVGVG
ncbi:MAG: AzlD domain-containing protein [Corynebacterium nuruki]|nr:AzlD domain-containing protein [Corynebacterium nuruki]